MPQRSIDDAVLLTSELATNAVEHARTPFDVTLTRRPGELRVVVADECGELPSPRTVTPTSVGGRGLQLVASLSSEWGAESVPDDGKIVWFDLPSR